MAVVIKYLEKDPVEIPKGGIQYFDIVGSSLPPVGPTVTFLASSDAAGNHKDNQITVDVDNLAKSTDKILPMIAKATESADSNPNNTRWVVIKVGGSKVASIQGLKVI
jgi:hypothetical protein